MFAPVSVIVLFAKLQTILTVGNLVRSGTRLHSIIGRERRHRHPPQSTAFQNCHRVCWSRVFLPSRPLQRLWQRPLFCPLVSPSHSLNGTIGCAGTQSSVTSSPPKEKKDGFPHPFIVSRLQSGTREQTALQLSTLFLEAKNQRQADAIIC